VSLRQALKGLIVVVAVMLGTTTSVFAHAGHGHAQFSASFSTRVSANPEMSAPTALAKTFAATAHLASVKQVALNDTGETLQVETFRSGMVTCPPGVCCCQGASSCGMGSHCCASMMLVPVKWTNDFSNHMRYHLARLGWVYPDVVIGLDRPPKA
jgi:hypothetical protein